MRSVADAVGVLVSAGVPEDEALRLAPGSGGVAWLGSALSSSFR